MFVTPAREKKLKADYQTLSNNQFSMRGYVCYLSDLHNGYGGFYFFHSKKEIRKFLPVLIYIYSIIQDDFTLISEEEIKQMNQLIKEYRNSKLENKDFDKFIKDTQCLIGYEILFFIKSRELFNPYSDNALIRRIQKGFRQDISLNKEVYIDYLNNFYS
jgi:hypothetical protein